MPCLFQLLLVTYFMQLALLIIQKNLQTLLRQLHWLVLIFDIKLKLCPMSAGLCMVSPLPASMHLSFLLCAPFSVTLTSVLKKKKKIWKLLYICFLPSSQSCSFCLWVAALLRVLVHRNMPDIEFKTETTRSWSDLLYIVVRIISSAYSWLLVSTLY